MRDHFGPDGTLSRDEEPFRFRKEQLDYADFVDDLIRRDGVGMVEGGTGVGKTLGYLVPHILDAKRTGRKVLVATRTRNLQDQIFFNDLPRLARTFNFTYALLKGRENYICRERLSDAIENEALFEGTARGRALKYLGNFDRLHATGDIEAALGFLKRYGADGQKALNDVRATDDTCTSDHRGICRHYRAIALAEKADIIVANHHLALYWPDSYPPISRVVFDEAHTLEEAASDVFGAKFAALFLHARLRRLEGSGRRGGGLLRKFTRRDQAEFGIDSIRSDIEIVRSGIATFESAADRYQDSTVNDKCRHVENDAWRDLEAVAAPLADAVTRLGRKIATLARDVAEVERLKFTSEKLVKNAVGLSELAMIMGSLFAPRRVEETVLWSERRPGRSPIFIRTPISIAAALRNLYDKYRSVLLTSATLQVAGDFAFLSDRLGLSENERTMPPRSVGHPFDYASRVLLGLVRGEKTHLAQQVESIARAAGGRTLALFTNKRRMLDAADALCVPGVDILAQHRDGSRHDLAEKLKKNPRTILLGTRSFWEGIDIPGENLSVVVIEKIPFTSPGEPVYDARCEAAGSNWFTGYALPIALLTLRQGFGRLIRTESDRGAVIILDPGKSSYARAIRTTLPECETIEADEATVLAGLQSFLKPSVELCSQ